MPQKRSPERDKAFQIYLQHKGQITLREIANMLNVPEKTVSGWKSKDNWDAVLFKNNTEYVEKMRSTPNKKETPNVEQKQIKDLELNETELNEKQQLFCLYYIKSFNATLAAIKAGYDKHSAHVQGCQLLKNPKIAEQIRRLKGQVAQELFLDAMDVLEKYIKIAFSDITDFIVFGQKREQVMGMYGPVFISAGKDADGNEIKKPVTQVVNFVDLKQSDMIDGTLIDEVSVGRQGVKIKLADRLKALDKLAEYFDLFPDKFKRRIEEEKLALLHRKNGDDPDGEEVEDDGFIAALKDTAVEDWKDYDKED